MKPLKKGNARRSTHSRTTRCPRGTASASKSKPDQYFASGASPPSAPAAEVGAWATVDTLGIVVDLNDEGGRGLAQATVSRTGDPELRNLISLADGLGKRYLVAAGRFNGKGITAVLCDDEPNLVAAFQMVNVRMDEIGSHTTAWMIEPAACAALLVCVE